MSDLRVLVTCRLVWDDEDRVRSYLDDFGVEVDIPRFSGQQMGEDDLIPILSAYHGILAGDDQLTRRVLESAPKLKVVSKWGIGIDGIDLEAAAELGIAVYNTPGVFRDELADYAMGYLHMLARQQHVVDARVKAGEWYKARGVSLAGKTLGIVGLGSSGRALAHRANAASMDVIGHDIVDVDDITECEVVSYEVLLARSDVISLHLPATAESWHLIDESSISRMKRGAWLINTSRGTLVDESALLAALRSGDLGGAALDVFETEPVSPDNPLLALHNVIVGSHNGSNTFEAVTKTTELALENLIGGLKDVGMA